MRVIDHRRPALATVDTIAIRCPRCGREAAFEPATYLLAGAAARAAADDPAVTGIWRGGAYEVIRYPRLKGWKDAVRRRRGWRPSGICRCGACGYLNRHLLDWPREAFYAVSLRGRTLWMRSREHALALRHYVAADDRQRVPGARGLSRVPKEFLAARNRAPLVKRIDALLADGPKPRAVASRPDPRLPRPPR